MYDVDDPILIKSAEESGLAAEINNPALLRFYMKNLMIRGWAGVMTPEEKRYTRQVREAFGKGRSPEAIERFAAMARARRADAQNV